MVNMLIKKNKKEQQTETEQREKCVSCGEITEYTKSTPIEKRIGYIQGGGQLCLKCYRELYPKGATGCD